MTSPISKCGRFRGVEFLLEDLPVVRALACGQTFDLRNGGYATDRECLERLAGTGFATKVEAIQPVANFREGRTRYRASDALLALPETPIVSFDVRAQNLGRSLDKPAQRKWRVKMRDKSKAPRKFPPLWEVQHQAGVAEKRSAMFEDIFTEQHPVEEGEVYQFSSPGLTKWYVQRFCSDNNLMKE